MEKDIIIEQCRSVEKKVTNAFFQKVAPILRRYKIYFQREHNTVLDRLGVDAVMAHNGRIEYVDIKHHASPRVRAWHPNFAFELESARRPSLDKRFEGWLTDPKKVTETYTFLFWDGIPDDIRDMRVCVLRRNDVITVLHKLGIDIKNWRAYTASKPLVRNGNRYWRLTQDIRIVQSCSLPEAPINIVVPWQLLKDITVIDEVFSMNRESVLAA